MGRRSRQREKLAAPTTDYADADGNVLTLRGAITPGTRREYAALVGGGSTREDTWHRAVEFLFERLAVCWTVNDVPTQGQRDLLARFRVATQEERRFVREALRAHLAACFPELEAP